MQINFWGGLVLNTVRIKFSKTGLASYFSHLDLQRVMARSLKKSGLPVWYSLGYNPHIYMTFTLPLSLGHESICESFDFRLNEEMDEQSIIDAMQDTLPQGIDITGAGEVLYDAKNIRWAKYRITIFDAKSKATEALKSYDALDCAAVSKTTKKKGSIDINLKELIKNIEMSENEENQSENDVTFTALFPAGVEMNINPNLLLEFLKNTYGIQVLTAIIVREKLFDENLVILL